VLASSKLLCVKTIRCALVLFVFFFGAALSFAQDAARMEEVVQGYVRARTFTGAVLVARGSDVVLSKGYGAANLEWDIPNTPTTTFRLGSVTKQFTAASILLLEERGKLTLDDPIGKHVRDVPAAWGKITIFNLLTHTSGIPNFTGLPDYPSLKLQDTPVAKTIGLAHGDTVTMTSERKEITLPVATLSKYVGTYEVAPGVNMMMRLVGDHLTTQLTGQGQIPVYAESDTKFFLKVVDAQVEFFTDASGAVTHAVMYQNGRERKVVRTSATVAEPPTPRK
jgi:hypothetical protein